VGAHLEHPERSGVGETVSPERSEMDFLLDLAAIVAICFIFWLLAR
jgi:hypothetical protein